MKRAGSVSANSERFKFLFGKAPWDEQSPVSAAAQALLTHSKAMMSFKSLNVLGGAGQ